MNKIATLAFSLPACGMVLAQSSTELVVPSAGVVPPQTLVQPAEPSAKPQGSALDSKLTPFFGEQPPAMEFSTGVTTFQFDSGDISRFDQKLSIKLGDCTDLVLSLPVYSATGKYVTVQDSGTGIGDLDIGIRQDLCKLDDLKVLDCDYVWFNALGGVDIPLDGEYSSGGTGLYLGGESGISWGKLRLSQSIKYTFVNDYSYVPALGGFVDGNSYEGTTKLSYRAYDRLDVFLALDQFQADGLEAIILGPGAECNLFEGVSCSAKAGMSLNGDMPTGSPDLVASFNLSIKF